MALNTNKARVQIVRCDAAWTPQEACAQSYLTAYCLYAETYLLFTEEAEQVIIEDSGGYLCLRVESFEDSQAVWAALGTYLRAVSKRGGLVGEVADDFYAVMCKKNISLSGFELYLDGLYNRYRRADPLGGRTPVNLAQANLQAARDEVLEAIRDARRIVAGLEVSL